MHAAVLLCLGLLYRTPNCNKIKSKSKTQYIDLPYTEVQFLVIEKRYRKDFCSPHRPPKSVASLNWMH